VVRNPLLKYTAIRIIKKANDYGDFFYNYHFYKLIFNVYSKLMESQIDIQLPYSWYFYGDLVEPETFEYVTGSSLGYYAPNNGKIKPIIEVPHLDIELSIRQKIDQVIFEEFSEITENNHYKKDYGQILLKKTYNKAPFEFQRLFNRGLLPFILDFKPKNGQKVLFPLVFDDINLRKLNQYLDLLVVNYPKQELSETYEIFLEWDDTVRLAELNDHSQIVDLVLEFCKFYCSLLRIKENKNISLHVIERWSNEFNDEIFSSYIKNLDKIRTKLLESHFSLHQQDQKTRAVVDKTMKLARDLSYEIQNGV
jgi:hypothetical protein